MPPCLTESDLEQLHAGALPTQQAEQFRAHLAACESCRRRDAAFLAEHNALVADLHQARDDDALGPAETLPVPPVDVELPSPAAARGSSNQPVIEGYEIVRELHRGGQGVVYQAVQASTKRKVAIKVLLEGPYASAAARRRFEREIELAASLKHPNIVAIFHSGRTSDGRQFCVMDYIRGVPLNQYVRDQKLPLEKALSLFTGVCEAVNYAHQKGVIHRDLKPSNILVDSAGVPRVLDFGLAKQVGGPEQTLVSMTGQVVGTLPYMSPEQARGNPDEIDIRTDVYSLGVVLYELLTGHFPYPVLGNMVDVLRHIADTPPTPPSRSWKSDSGVSERTSRRLRPGACPIDDEVQTIVLRALTKERQRRYQSAADLGNDIGHYLKNEPIEAKRDSALYVLRKQLWRHRAAALSSVTLVIALSTIAITMSIQSARNAQLAKDNSELAEQEREAKRLAISASRRAWEASTQAIAARDESREALARAVAAREEAIREQNASEQLGLVLSGMFSGIRHANKRGYDTRILRAMLNEAARKVEQGGITGSPDVELRLRLIIGNTYVTIHEYHEAARILGPTEPMARKQYGDEHPVLSDTLVSNAHLILSQRRDSAARDKWLAGLRMRRRLLGVNDSSIMWSYGDLAAHLLSHSDFLGIIDLLPEVVPVMQSRLNGNDAQITKFIGLIPPVMWRIAKPERVEDAAKELGPFVRTLAGDDESAAFALRKLSDFLSEQGYRSASEILAHEAQLLFQGNSISRPPAASQAKSHK